jgi:hypothetical protein
MVFMTPHRICHAWKCDSTLAGLAGSRIEKAAFLWRGEEGSDRVEIRGLISKGFRPLLMRHGDRTGQQL